MDVKETLKKKKDPELVAVIKNANLLDDAFSRRFFYGHTKEMEVLLNAIYGRRDMKVLTIDVQKLLLPVAGHSVVLDVHAVDESGKHYDIEFQRDKEGASAARARYQSSVLDSVMLEKGATFTSLRENHVIFVVETDVRGRGKMLYHYLMKEESDNETFGDGRHIYYVNTSIVDDVSELGRVIHDIKERDVTKLYNPIWKKRWMEIKGNVESDKENDMYKTFSEYVNEKLAEKDAEFVKKTEEVKSQTTEAMVVELLKTNLLPIEQIASVSKKTVEEVKEIAIKYEA